MRTVHLNQFYGMDLTGIICSLSFTGTSRSNIKASQKELCLFCEQPPNESPLSCSYFPIRSKSTAMCSPTKQLHAKLQQGDMIAQDAMYHDNCLIEMYRTPNSKQLEGHYTDSERQLHGIALSVIIFFIEENTI